MTHITNSNQASRCATCAHSEFCTALFPDPRAVSGDALPRFRGINAGKQIIAQGHLTEDVLILCVGWAIRYLQLPDGSKQILRFLLPGDIMSPSLVYETVAETSVKALTAIQTAALKRSDIEARYGDRDFTRSIANYLVKDGHQTEVLLAVVAHMSGEERVAHLLLHLMRRIAAKTVIREERYPFPLRQQHIADAIGLTSVHVSRILSGLRERKIVNITEGTLEVLNRAELNKIGAASWPG